MPDLETEISRNDAYAGLSEDTTYITAKTVIVGNIETEDDIDVMGRVEGDVNCKGKLIIGICNGFQVLVKMGVLPNFDGNWTLDYAKQMIQQNSRHYAKKQLTWFKRDEEIQWETLTD